jgi:transposase
MKNLNIGIDVAKDKLDICILNEDKADYIQILNREDSIKDFLSYLKDTYKKFTFRFGYEATSTYMNKLRETLDKNNNLQIMVNPYQMSHYLKSVNLREKTDIKDSYGIAKFISDLKEDDFKTIHNDNHQLFRKYNTTIDLLSKISTQLKNLIKSQKDIKSKELDEIVQTLQIQIIKIKKEIEKQAIKIMNEIYPQTKKIKEDIKGVGNSLLLQLVPIFIQSQNYTIKQIQSYIGLSPQLFESGSSVKKKEVMSKKGNSLVRKMLYMNTMVAIQYNEIIRDKFNRLVEKGKEKMVALVACMCHLLRAVFIKFNEYTISSK